MIQHEIKETPIKQRFSKITKRFQLLTPGWKGASIAITIIAIIMFFIQSYFFMGSRGYVDVLIGTSISLIVIVGITGILAGAFHLTKRVPTRYIWLVLVSFFLLTLCFIGMLQVGLIISVTIIAALSVLGALIYRWKSGVYREVKLFSRTAAVILAAISMLFIVIIGYWLIDNGNTEPASPFRLQEMKSADRYFTAMTNPALQGTYEINSLTYGSANNYRKEFIQSTSLVTKSVDGSAFVDNWSTLRKKTFGFGSDQMPLNGQVWYPDGEGPFPLIITVHGNHIATDYSDKGYDYLGKLLASRGYIFVSIDENFLNSSPFDDLLFLQSLKNENSARGWLMLEHMKVWKAWNETKDNPFNGKVDMSRIALIGHSRGGEAITAAAAFNQMTAYPEDGNVKFDYHFSIRSIISIAGTDGQYKPAGQSTSLKDLNYLALHGSHDMDVISFSALNQYNRIGFTEGSDYFKASVYLYGMNHGQFNTIWGKNDSIGLSNKLYNTKQLITQEEQMEAAKVLISSFLDATLKDNNDYRSVFQDIGYARDWLPNTMYISNYMDSQTTLISNFEEDIDPGTTTLSGGRLIGENLKLWKEEKVAMKYGPDMYSAVKLGWTHMTDTDTPSYTVVLPVQHMVISDNSSIVFSMADVNEKQELIDQDSLIDLTLTAEDKHGNVATLSLSSESYLLPMFAGNIVKFPFASLMPTKEPVFQNFAFQLIEFKKNNPDFQPEQLSKFSFVFDKTNEGTILIRDIGIRNNNAQNDS
ncbi:MFS transporter [Paenibacillus sp. GXUN7292]|uniref:MFS transporter n=1 Tax=Paenibacillus sp. GXUN7292 TaxID=3422499 RepID=UPI003D7DE9FF